MPSVGPQLPPHLDKRKRDSDGDDDEIDNPSSTTPESNTSKRPRTIGPSLPPAPLDERPHSPPTPPREQTKATSAGEPGSDPASDSDSSDDGFGPSLPPPTSSSSATTNHPTQTPSTYSSNTPTPAAAPPAAPPAAKRGDWMLIPPSTQDWSSRAADPSKLKARKFTSHKPSSASSKATGGGGKDGAWDETPEQKHARLQRQVLGGPDVPSTTSTSATGSNSGRSARQVAEDEETRARLKVHAAARGPSLYNAHQKRDVEQGEKDDDPSARAFDREKDIGGGLQVNSTQRREMMKKAAGFSSRFGEAKYL